MMNHVNSQIKNRRRNTVIARGKIINIEHNEDYSYLKLFIRNGAGLRHTYLTFRYDPKIFYISKNQKTAKNKWLFVTHYSWQRADFFYLTFGVPYTMLIVFFNHATTARLASTAPQTMAICVFETVFINLCTHSNLLFHQIVG